MRRRLLGLSATGTGLVLMVIGLLMLASSAGTVATTTTTAPTTTTTAPTTTTARPTTTTTSPVTTTVPVTTTTLPPQTVEDFVTEYRTALDQDDIDFLIGRLHPRVIEAYGEEMCQRWVTEEVALLEAYELAGEATGPADQMFTGPGGEQIPIADTFTAPVTFNFQGEAFDSVAQFALLHSVMFWLGTCK